MRYWNNKHADDGSIHCLGNGRMAVYEQGPNIMQIFGPPYSSPSFMKLLISDTKQLECKSKRKAGTAIWKHEIYISNQQVGKMLDFVVKYSPCMVRKLNLTSTIVFTLKIDSQIDVVLNSNRFACNRIRGAILATAESGIYIYGRYPSPQRLSHQVVVQGNAKLNKGFGDEWTIECLPGESLIYFIGGPSYPECIQNTENILQRNYEDLIKDTESYWLEYIKRGKNFDAILPLDTPNREFLLDAIENVAILIKTQQAEDGGVLAGHNYHMGYVRDQYGVSRCLLTLGYLDEAKAILDFYWKIWQRYFFIHNAQAMGVDGVFHIHENDEVEITGYLIIQAFDYYQASKDEDFIVTILPMLTWAWEVQTKHLADHMLPFNGDETYVAGGILPRSVLNDGSAEATMLFIIAGERLLNWVNEKGVWDSEKIKRAKSILVETQNHYFRNFWNNGRIITNNPNRKYAASLPRFRHGVCEGCQSKKRPMYFGWTEKNKNGWYLCPSCFSDDDWDLRPDEKYELPLVGLMPLYMNSAFFKNDMVRSFVERIVNQYRETCKLPSRLKENRVVGYDYGLLLYNLTELNLPFAREIYDKMLAIMDSTGSWAEYYEDDQPVGTRYRPWESAINLEAAIHYAMGHSWRKQV